MVFLGLWKKWTSRSMKLVGGPFFRVHIVLDITKLIQCGRLVLFSSIGQLWVSFKYERLPWLCFSCGIIGHLERDCTLKPRRSSSSSEELKQFGAWLRDTYLVPRQNAGGGGWSLPQQFSPVQPYGFGRGKFSNFENNRHADLVGNSVRHAWKKSP